jgi:hypothetical protein
MSDYQVSQRQARKQLVHKERLRASMAATYDSALRWYNACQALGTPGLGDGQPVLGEIISNVVSVPEGHKKLVRWHDGTITTTWIPGQMLLGHDQPKWIVATTCWNDPAPGPWLTERVMRVEILVDAMPATIIKECDQYWDYSREHDELDLKNLLMIAPPDPAPSLPQPDPQPDLHPGIDSHSNSRNSGNQG